MKAFVRRGQSMTARLENSPKPVTRGLNASIGEGLQIESEQFARMVATLDVHEGLGAWIERRTPDYQGCRGVEL